MGNLKLRAKSLDVRSSQLIMVYLLNPTITAWHRPFSGGNPLAPKTSHHFSTDQYFQSTGLSSLRGVLRLDDVVISDNSKSASLRALRRFVEHRVILGILCPRRPSKMMDDKWGDNHKNDPHTQKTKIKRFTSRLDLTRGDK